MPLTNAYESDTDAHAVSLDGRFFMPVTRPGEPEDIERVEELFARTRPPVVAGTSHGAVLSRAYLNGHGWEIEEPVS